MTAIEQTGRSVTVFPNADAERLLSSGAVIQIDQLSMKQRAANGHKRNCSGAEIELAMPRVCVKHT
jgi:hypothetical protein